MNDTKRSEHWKDIIKVTKYILSKSDREESVLYIVNFKERVLLKKTSKSQWRRKPSTSIKSYRKVG